MAKGDLFNNFFFVKKQPLSYFKVNLIKKPMQINEPKNLRTLLVPTILSNSRLPKSTKMTGLDH